MSFCYLLFGCVNRPPETMVTAAVRGRTDAAEVTRTDDGTAVMVTNPSGIGTVRIGRGGPQWPTLLAVRLVYSADKEFQTLNTLRIRAGADTATMEGRTAGLGARDVLFFSGDGPAAAYRGSYRIEIQHRARYLQITLPPEFLKHAGEMIELSWVDQM